LSARQSISPLLGFGDQLNVSSVAVGVLSNIGARVAESNGFATQASVTADGFATFLSNATGVNLDDELTRLLQIENSYRATTKTISAVDSLYQSLFEAVR
jgi:flagellar hook-associated protein 1 FlgK